MTIHDTTSTPRVIKSARRRFPGYGMGLVSMRYDDALGNGSNSFAITVEARDFGGCMHDMVREVFPELAHLIKWHLVSTDGPMHYLDNTTYHARNGDLGYARSTAGAPDATIEQLQDTAWLTARLPALLEDFRGAMDATFGVE